MGYSFRNYIEKRYMEQIEKKVRSFLLYNKEKMDFLSKYNDVNWIDIEDVYIKNLFAYASEGNKVLINIIVEAYLTIKEYNYAEGYNDSFGTHQWFLVKCIFDLKNDEKEFVIKEVEEFSSLGKNQNRLSDSLIPYIKKEKLDDIASKILDKIYPSVVHSGSLNPYVLIQKFGLKIEEVSFKKEGTLGQIFFDDVKTKSGKIIKANTIRVSKSDFEENKNFTIMHEVSHYILHRFAFMLEKKYKKKNFYIKCLTDGTALTQADIGDIEAMEWQANALAAHMLMPKENVLRYTNEKLQECIQLFPDIIEAYEHFIMDMAKHYGVPFISAKIRLAELGYDFSQGIYIYVDGHKVKSHCFKEGSLKLNETYCISEQDAAFLMMKNLNIEELQAYVFVDNFIVINSNKYIKRDSNNRMILTDYALHHMDECALKFEVKYSTNGQCDDFVFYKILSRKSNKAEMVVNVETNIRNSISCNNQKEYEEYRKVVYELRNSMTTNIWECLRKVREYSGYTIEEIIEGTNISKTTVEKYFYNKDISYSREILLKLLFFMNCPGQVIKIILNNAGCPLMFCNESHQWLDFTIEHYWIYPYDEIIRFLEKKGIKLS